MSEIAATSLGTDVNLIAYYRLESGSLINDSKGTFTLTNTGTVVGATGKYGNAGNWNGAGSNQILGTSNALGITNGSISLVAWVNMNSAIAATDVRRFIGVKGDASTFITYQFDYQYNNGTPRINFERLKEFVADDQVLGTFTLGTGTWYHLALTYDVTKVRGYINGTPQGTTASSGNGNTAGSTIVGIGNNSLAGVYQADAIIDDFGIFNRALNAAEIGTLSTDVVVVGGGIGFKSLLGVGQI